MSVIIVVIKEIFTEQSINITCGKYMCRQGGVRHLKHPSNLSFTVYPLLMICLGRGKSYAGFELSLIIQGQYYILYLANDLALYIWHSYTPHTTSKTGTPRLKATRRTARAGNAIDVTQ